VPRSRSAGRHIAIVEKSHQAGRSADVPFVVMMETVSNRRPGTIWSEGDANLQFLSMVKSAEGFRAGPPPQALIEAIAQLGEEAGRAGVMVGMGGLLPSAAGARVTLRKGRLTVIDGPFSEAKEVIGGYAFFSVPSLEEALHWTVRFMETHQAHWPEWEGETEIRQIEEMA